jgi:hypothetical protein
MRSSDRQWFRGSERLKTTKDMIVIHEKTAYLNAHGRMRLKAHILIKISGAHYRVKS